MEVKALAACLALGATLGLAARWTAAALGGGSARPGPAGTAAIGGAMALSAVAGASGGWSVAIDALLGWTLLALALTDLAVMRLPDLLTLPLAAGGIAVAAATSAPGARLMTCADHALGAGVGYLAFAGMAYGYRAIRGREGLGMGDAKLAAAAGAWLGWQALPAVVLAGCAAAFAWVALRVLREGRASLHRPLPFGAPLSLAVWACWVAPPGLRAALGWLS
jgi:leader peptidase (prepilin peptidase)/N-methyltransferase